MSDATPERWLPIPGWERAYEVSDFGRVRSLPRITEGIRGRRISIRGRVTSGSNHNNGYRRVILSAYGRVSQQLVHRLVLLAFSGPCPDGLEVCHGNGVRSDNRLTNLRYDTPEGNAADRKLHGTEYKLANTDCPRGHPLSGENLMIRPTECGVKRICLRCHRVTTRENLRKYKGYYDRRGLTPPTLDAAIAELDRMQPLG